MNLPVPVLAEPNDAAERRKHDCVKQDNVSEARESTETDKPATDHRALERGSGSDSRGGQNNFPVPVLAES
jgi:hypothetical protein